MRYKGFTLIELLAVIVILAIIALIAIPMTSAVVSNAKMNSMQSSALGYLEALEQTRAINLLNADQSDDIEDGVYSLPLNQYNIKVKGIVPNKGWVQISNNAIEKYSLLINDYTVSFDGNNKTVVKGNHLLERPKVYPEYVYSQTKTATLYGYPIDPNTDMGEKYVATFGNYKLAFDSESECQAAFQALGQTVTCLNQRFYTTDLGYLLYPNPNWNGYIRYKLTSEGLIESADVCYKNGSCLSPTIISNSYNDIKLEMDSKFPYMSTSTDGDSTYSRFIENEVWIDVVRNTRVGILDYDSKTSCGILFNSLIGCEEAS